MKAFPGIPMRLYWHNQRGQAAVELALVFVFFLLFSLGVSEVARALLNLHQLTQAAREGARAASLVPILHSETSRQRVRSRIEKVLQVMGKDIQKIDIGIYPADSGGDGNPDLVDITLRENFSQLTPISLLPELSKLVFTTTISMPLFMPQEEES